MRFSDKKIVVLALAASVLVSCTGNIPSNQGLPVNNHGLQSNAEYGNVKFFFDFPEKFVKADKAAFGIKRIDSGKINRVKVTVKSATTDFSIERNVELVPGGIEASISIPLDRLYTVTVQGLNDTESVSGALIKGYFPLLSAGETPTVEINQFTTPVASIIEGVKEKFGEIKTTTDTTENTGTEETETTETTEDTDTAEISKPINNITDVIDLALLNDTVTRARGAAHPSLVNPAVFVSEILTNKKTPSEIPANALLKPGRVKGIISGLKANEVAIVTVGDPSSSQTIVVTPPIVTSGTATPDPDATAAAIDFMVDNVTPGQWPITAVASGFTSGGTAVTVNVAANTEASSSFSMIPSAWLDLPLHVSGNIGTSDQPSAVLDAIDNIHLAWRQDAFTTDSNSGIIFYSRWNGTSWTTQRVNVSQYNDSQLRGSKDPSVAVGLDRLPHIIWSAKNSSGARGVYYNSFDGTTWKTPELIPGSEEGIKTSLTVDKTNGFLYAAWENSSGNILFSRFDRTSWSSPITLGTGSMPKAASGTDGIVHVIWKDRNVQKIRYAGFKIKDQSIISEDVPFGSLGPDSDNLLDLSVDRFNRVHAIWRNAGNIQYILRSNTSWSQPEVVNQISTVMLQATTGASISIAPTGIVSVAWTSLAADGDELIRFRRRLNSGWKKPFEEIEDINSDEDDEEDTGNEEDTEIEVTENSAGYENIPLSHVNKVEGAPLIITDNSGKIHVIWSNRGNGVNDTDLLHSIKKQP